MYKKMLCIIGIIAISIASLMSMKNETVKIAPMVPDGLKKGWKQLSFKECPKGTPKTHAKQGWFVFMRDMVFVQEDAIIVKLASDFGLEDEIECCNFIWPISVENFRYTGKIFLFIKKEVIETFKKNFKFELYWEKTLDEEII